MVITFYKLSHKYVTVEVQFMPVERVKGLSYITFKREEMFLRPLYMRIRTAKIEKVSRRMDMMWIMAALCRGREDKMIIMSVLRYASQI